MGTVLIVRHAETAWNREGRVQGWASTSLTDRGREQARALASTLGDVIDGTADRLIASDLRRARETAEEIERATGCQPAFEQEWRERDVGRLQGVPAGELFERYPRLSLKHAGEDAAHARPEGGETLIETRERVLDAWDRLRVDLAGEETAVVVTHSGPISLLLGHLRNDTIPEAILDRTQDNGAVTELRVDGEGDDVDGTDVRLVRENWTGYRTRAVEP